MNQILNYVQKRIACPVIQQHEQVSLHATRESSRILATPRTETSEYPLDSTDTNSFNNINRTNIKTIHRRNAFIQMIDINSSNYNNETNISLNGIRAKSDC